VSLPASGRRAEDDPQKRYEKKGLTYIPIWEYILFMARAATTSDPFNAVAEPRRREILEYLANDEREVGQIVVALRLEQPSVSKHLRVLREVGLVRVRRNGRHMLYKTNAQALRPLHEWTGYFEKLWTQQLNRVKDRAEQKELEKLYVKEAKETKKEKE
jgi:DNA-binding transcriptional ArsR family regulator